MTLINHTSVVNQQFLSAHYPALCSYLDSLLNLRPHNSIFFAVSGISSHTLKYTSWVSEWNMEREESVSCWCRKAYRLLKVSDTQWLFLTWVVLLVPKSAATVDLRQSLKPAMLNFMNCIPRWVRKPKNCIRNAYPWSNGSARQQFYEPEVLEVLWIHLCGLVLSWWHSSFKIK